MKSTVLAPDWGLMLIMIWGAGASVGFAQMLIGWAMIERLRRRATPLATPAFTALTRLLEIEGSVDLVESAPGSMPSTYGLLHPVIFMPADATDWSDERRQAVLLHELAHVRRWDPAAHLLARSAAVLYWWNPLVWTALRELSKEQERSADDLVLCAGTCPSEYATHLLEIARSMQSPAALSWAALGMVRPSQLEGRLSAILDVRRDRKAPRRASVIAASFAAISIVAPVAALQTKTDTAQATIVDRAEGSSAAADLIKQGDSSREQKNYDNAAALYRKALKAAANGHEAATALFHLGIVELAMKNFEEAIGDFEQAQTADSGKVAEARMWMAIVRDHQNNLEAADGLYQSALAAEDSNSAAAATTMELYAQLLQQQGRKEEATSMSNQAASIRKEQPARAISSNQPSSSEVYRIGGDVTAPVLLSKVEPAYTEVARIAKYQGTAALSVEVGVDGSVRDIKVVRALGFGLDEKAIEAVIKWKFKPASKDGQPVPVAAMIEVNFRLL